MKKAVIIHSGGMDSSLCLYLAIQEFGADQVISVTFDYNQRHNSEIIAAATICRDWGVDHKVFSINILNQITDNALINSSLSVKHGKTLVAGRNGLMARLGALFADRVGAEILYMGVIGVEESNSGYRDCSREYMDLMQQILQIDLANPNFEIRTPLVAMTKLQVLQWTQSLGILDELLEKTVTCYEGLKGSGCRVCPACELKLEALSQLTNNSFNL